MFRGEWDFGYDCEEEYDDEELFQFEATKPLHLYTQTERIKIETACRKKGKESPWAYTERQRVATAERITSQQKLEVKKAEEELPTIPKAKRKVVLSLLQQRNAIGLSQKEAAKLINVKVTVLQAWESGKVKPAGPKFGKLKTHYKRKLANKSKKK